MPCFRLLAVGSLLSGLLVLLPPVVSAQRVSFDPGRNTVESITLGYYLLDFTFNGDKEPTPSFNFNQPIYGLIYNRPHFAATVAYGRQAADPSHENLRLLDVSLTTWGDFVLTGTGGTRLFIPILLHTNYRSVVPLDGNDSPLGDFNVTTVGLGAGLGFDHEFGSVALLEARAHPIIGFSTTSFTDALGKASLFETDVQVHFPRVFRRMGITLGYGFHAQVWNLNASDLFPDVTDELFDYRGHHHLFRVGINW